MWMVAIIIQVHLCHNASLESTLQTKHLSTERSGRDRYFCRALVIVFKNRAQDAESVINNIEKERLCELEIKSKS